LLRSVPDRYLDFTDLASLAITRAYRSSIPSSPGLASRSAASDEPSGDRSSRARPDDRCRRPTRSARGLRWRRRRATPGDA
jgi:hypothetical protein